MIVTRWDTEHLPEAVRRYNIMAEALAMILPRAADAVHGTPVTVNKVNKKTHQAIDGIIKAHMPEDPVFRCYFNTDFTYSLYLSAGFNSPTSERSCEYGHIELGAIAHLNRENDRWIKNEYLIPPPPRSLEEIANTIAAAEKADEYARIALENSHSVTRLCQPFAKER